MSVDEKDNRIEYILDDSTSHLGIVFWLNYNDQHSSLSSSKLLLHNHPSRRRIRLGDAVRISGKVSKYKHTIKVTAYDIGE